MSEQRPPAAAVSSLKKTSDVYTIREVDGVLNRAIIEGFNDLDPHFPELQKRHFENGFWWLAFMTGHPDAVGEVEAAVAFAGLVPFGPPKTGYLKRCLVLHRGHGLQYRLMMARELKARQLGWTMLISDCDEKNEFSANNFRRAGFEQFAPDQPWCQRSLFWVKEL